MKTMNALLAFLSLLTAHWLGDFILQTRWQAENKSKNNVALFRHVLVYTAVIGAAALALFGPGPWWALFVIGNGVLHFATDYVTSRVTARLYAKQDWANFWITIGFDQLIHQVTLGFSLMWLLSTLTQR